MRFWLNLFKSKRCLKKSLERMNSKSCCETRFSEDSKPKKSRHLHLINFSVHQYRQRWRKSIWKLLNWQPNLSPETRASSSCKNWLCRKPGILALTSSSPHTQISSFLPQWSSSIQESCFRGPKWFSDIVSLQVTHYQYWKQELNGNSTTNGGKPTNNPTRNKLKRNNRFKMMT